MTAELDRKLVRGSAWLALSYGGSQVVSLVVTAVLAHILAPSAFGLVALASIAIVALGFVQESGLGLAVIHRRTNVEEAAGSALAFTLVGAVVLYLIAFPLAPIVADLFHQHRLGTIVRVLLLMLPIRAAGAIPGALIEREVDFGARARGELGGVVAQAATAVTLALLGFGVWALVAGQLANQAVQSAAFWYLTPLRPSLRRARWKMLRELARYGRHVTAGNIVGLVDSNVDTVVAGRMLGAAGVGYYSLAWRLCNLPAIGLAYIVGRVMFPAYASMREDIPAFRDAFLTNLRRVALVSLPTGLIILIAARPIVVAIFGSTWQPAVAPLRILAVFGLVRSFAGTTGSVFQAAGRPQLVYQISLWHLTVLVAGLAALAPPFGIKGIASAVAIAAVASCLPSYWFVLRILDLRLGVLLRNLVRPVSCSLPLVVALLAAVGALRGLTPVDELLVVLIVALVTYIAAVAFLGRAEIRAIAAAFHA